MQATLQIFHRLYDNLPPLFPAQIKEHMQGSLLRLERDQDATAEDIEDSMIMFGYALWPFNQAYRKFLVSTEERLGEHFLLPKLSLALQAKYEKFKCCGGAMRDLHSGNAAHFFNAEERVELCRGLIETGIELQNYTRRSVIGEDRSDYLEEVEEFKKLLHEISDILSILRALARKEEYEYPALAREILARVRAFEFGLCLLGPELKHEAVCESLDFFRGRKLDMSRLRGIQVPAQLVF